MAIPDYQTLMLPVLKASAKGEVRIADVVAQVSKEFGLTPDDVATMLPSGKQTIVSNRTHWAKAYLAKAGLVEATRRGCFRITTRGLTVLTENPKRIDVPFLMKYEEFRKFREGGGEGKAAVQFSALTPTTEPTEFATPDEVLRSTVQKINSTLATELLGRILAAPPSFFEQVVVKLLLGMGFGGSREQAGRAIGASGDGGLDGVIDQDALGLDRIYLQAKRYAAERPVSEPEVREFSGALSAAKANKGVFVTTSYFTKPAADFVNRIPSTIVLIDAEELTSLMIRYNVGVRDEEVISIKKIDEDFFDTD
jgi:restriction system protein